jgi:nitrate/nitrite transporter NarK
MAALTRGFLCTGDRSIFLLFRSYLNSSYLLPTVGRVRIIQAKFEPIQYQLLSHHGFLYVWIWGFFINFGHILALYTLATYSTSGLGFTQSQGSSLQAILAAGQMVGRPLAGMVMDRFGRINVAAIVTFSSGLSCLVIWMFSRTYGLLAFFAIVQGRTSLDYIDHCSL